MTDILSTPPSAQAYAEEERRRSRNAEMSRPSRRQVEEHNKRVMAQAGDRLMASTTSVAPEPAPPVGSHPPVPDLTAQGDIGQAVIDLVRFDRIEAARTRTMSRVIEEERALVDEAMAQVTTHSVDQVRQRLDDPALHPFRRGIWYEAGRALESRHPAPREVLLALHPLAGELPLRVTDALAVLEVPPELSGSDTLSAGK